MATPRARELSVYDGQECIGTIKVAEDGAALAFDQCGKLLGSFPSLKTASAAFNSHVEQTAPASRSPGIGIHLRRGFALPRLRVRQWPRRRCANRISERTQEAMRDPSVRQRVREGMARAGKLRAGLYLLRMLREELSEEKRAAFLREIVSSTPNRS
jgi:hypothetical protein